MSNKQFYHNAYKNDYMSKSGLGISKMVPSVHNRVNAREVSGRLSRPYIPPWTFQLPLKGNTPKNARDPGALPGAIGQLYRRQKAGNTIVHSANKGLKKFIASKTKMQQVLNAISNINEIKSLPTELQNKILEKVNRRLLSFNRT